MESQFLGNGSISLKCLVIDERSDLLQLFVNYILLTVLSFLCSMFKTFSDVYCIELLGIFFLTLR